MSQWTEIDGRVSTTAPRDEASRVLTSNIPAGTEGPARVSEYLPGEWMIIGSLRDRGEDDVPAIRDWFVAAVESLGDSVAEAELELAGYRWTYVYALTDGRVRLVVPQLYVEEMRASSQ